jgi:hypothetical protein
MWSGALAWLDSRESQAGCHPVLELVWKWSDCFKHATLGLPNPNNLTRYGENATKILILVKKFIS